MPASASPSPSTPAPRTSRRPSKVLPHSFLDLGKRGIQLIPSFHGIFRTLILVVKKLCRLLNATKSMIAIVLMPKVNLQAYFC